MGATALDSTAWTTAITGIKAELSAAAATTTRRILSNDTNTTTTAANTTAATTTTTAATPATTTVATSMLSWSSADWTSGYSFSRATTTTAVPAWSLSFNSTAGSTHKWAC